jgi:hypothetical protein
MGFEYHYMMCDAVPNPGRSNADLHVPTDKLEASLGAMTSS